MLMLTNRAVPPFHGACSIAFILANCQNTIKEAETDFSALYQAILCIVEFSTVLKNWEFASCKILKVLFAERCALLQNPLTPTACLLPEMGPLKCLFSLSTSGSSFSHSRLQIISVGSGFLHGRKRERFGAVPTLCSAHPAPGLSCPETVPEACLGWEVCSFPASPKPKTAATPERTISVRWL